MTHEEMIGRSDRLRRFLEIEAAGPCRWGKDDCSFLAGRWIEAERRIDLGLPVYSSEEEARTMIEAAGGLATLWSRYLALAGLAETGAPLFGDVAIFATERFGDVGGIVMTDGILAWRAETGVTCLRPRRIVKAWSV